LDEIIQQNQANQGAENLADDDGENEVTFNLNINIYFKSN